MDKAEFEILFLRHKSALERYVYYKIQSKADGDDIIQEVALAAFRKIDEIKNLESFKPWILKIAANKCNDFYRNLAKSHEIPLDEMTDNIVSMTRYGVSETEIVRDALSTLSDKDKQILFLYYFRNKPQAEIAAALKIPLGTVKSRLHTAKQNFKNAYPFPPETKGAEMMKNLPNIMPDYQIAQSAKEAFEVKWEETMGWFIVPKLGEKITWAMYDYPKRERTETVKMEVIGKAAVHGIEGVEILSTEEYQNDFDMADKNKTVERTFIAQLTDTYCRFLLQSHMQNGVKKIHTFLDGDDFIPNWGFGEDNCGKEVNLKPKGIIKKNGGAIICAWDMLLGKAGAVMDVAGRYDVEINGKIYDTICLIDIELYNPGVLAEQYIDKSGKTVLWRRFNKNDWNYKLYNKHFNCENKLWDEMFPENERIAVNGEIYVHWYDCITDYIL